MVAGSERGFVFSAESIQPWPLSRPVIFSCSRASGGVPGFWEAAYGALRDYAVFVGTREEHRAFVSEVGPIWHFETLDERELVELIAGARLLVGNDGVACLIAEELKKPTILQVDDSAAAARVERANALHVADESGVKWIATF